MEQVIERVRGDLKSSDPTEREAALDLLGGIRGDYLADIAGALDDPDPEVRASAGVNLGRLRRAEAWPLLAAAVGREPTDEALRGIIWALGKYYDPLILDRLLTILSERNREYQVRLEIVTQLWKYDRESALNTLREVVVSDDDDIVRGHAADSLAVLYELHRGESWFQPLWIKLADDECLGVATVAQRNLQLPQSEPARNVRQVVARHLRSPESTERSHALHRLAMLGAPDVLDVDVWSPMSGPKDALELALPLRSDPDGGVRASFCYCLGALRDERSIEPLRSALSSDPTENVQIGALVGLEEYHSDEIGDSLLQVLETSLLSKRALPILYRQLWKYPSERTVIALRARLTSAADTSTRKSIEGALRLMVG